MSVPGLGDGLPVALVTQGAHAPWLCLPVSPTPEMQLSVDHPERAGCRGAGKKRATRAHGRLG